MDEIRKWTLYLMFLVAGFATGIGTIGLFPQFWMEYGLTGLVVHLLFLAVFTYVAITEAEKVIKSGYYFVELYNKVLRKPAMMLAVLAMIVVFLSYYTANTMLVLLSPIVGTGTIGRLIAKVLMVAIVFIVLTRAKEKTFTIMAAGSMVLVISVVVTTVAFVSKIPPTAAFLGMAKHMIMSRHPITVDLVMAAIEKAIYGVGLGFAFYLMLGSFMNERFNAKLIIGAGVIIQTIIGLLATITMVYAIAPSTPEELLKYVYGGEEGAIHLMGQLPTILADYKGLLLLIAVSIFLAGITSILPISEVGLQIIEFNTRVGRNRAAMYLMGLVLLVGVPDSVPSLAQALLLGVSTAVFFTAVFEYIPVISNNVERVTGIQPSTTQKVAGTILFVALIPMGLYSLYTTVKSGGVNWIGALLAVVLVGFGALGNEIFGKKE
ncbi:sodium-dependent transporter [Thermococcus nautili]|uniref:Putative membrane protein, conserved n=1 Tax=Thermococcus nautili TaxID=195522 RepID=W8NR25_9EURY|nr:sodium-dependent transporter [Thermococcus nautili]AHL21663.1 putative membrane protein, conserved [Thermococcus nautili]